MLVKNKGRFYQTAAVETETLIELSSTLNTAKTTGGFITKKQDGRITKRIENGKY